MFAVLEIEKYEKGFLKRLKRIFEKNEPILRYETVKGAMPHIVLQVQETSKGINWSDVRNILGVCSNRLLLPHEQTIPDGYGIYRFNPTIYPIIPIFNNMIEVFKLLDLNDIDLNVTVLDKFGALSDKIDILAKYARHITVLTNDSKSYKKTSQRIIETFGAALVIFDYDHCKINDKVILTDFFDKKRLKNREIVFCADNFIEFPNVVTAKELQTDNFVLEKKNEQIDLFDFTAALYEYNGFKRAGEYAYKKCYLGKEEVCCEKLSYIIQNVLI